MPPMDEGAGHGLLRPLAYIIDKPIKVLQLGLTRLMVEFVHVRSVYSFAHNFVVSLYLLPCYALALLGVVQVAKNSVSLLISLVILVHCAITMLTFPDWDGRFLLYILPLIGIFSGIGLGCVFQLITDRMGFKFQFFGKIQ